MTASKKNPSKSAAAAVAQLPTKPAKIVPHKAPKVAPAKAAKNVKATSPIARNKSSVEHPVVFVWDLCNSMLESRRKDVIEAAVQKGVNVYTARTQYQLWLVASRNSK